jgi:hypothetical protein
MNQGGMGSMGAGGLNPMMGGLNPMLAAGMSGLAGMNGMSAESMNMFAQVRASQSYEVAKRCSARRRTSRIARAAP